jgi:hypothetical protein
MEEQIASTETSLIDMQSYNPTPMVCENILRSARSLLKFNGNQLDDVNSNIEIYNTSVQYIFQFLRKIDYFDDMSSYEILANGFNYSMIVKGKALFDLTKLNLIIKLSYYQINDDIIIDNKFIDWYGIKKNVKTFTQRDDNIRMHLNQTLLNETINSDNNIIFIGGEMYTFAKILNYHKGIAFTDFDGIKKDTEENNLIQTYLINYKEDNIIQYIDSSDINPNTCVVNVLNGLGENLIKQINSLNINKLMIINCKPSVMESDIELIKLKLTKIYQFITPQQQIKLYVFIK